MDGYHFRLANSQDRPAIFSFLSKHWDLPTPLIDHPDFFNYYYVTEDGGLRFALAESGGEISALAGYIPASSLASPDLWVSIWVADPAAKGSGLELMAALPGLTGCGTLACNNIRPKTRAFYEFLGYSTGRFHHYYRLADKPAYQLAVVNHKTILPVQGSARLAEYQTEEDYLASGFQPPANANPYKDNWYLLRRYYRYPHQKYKVFGVYPDTGCVPRALLVCRVIPAAGTAVLRIADFLGDTSILAQAGPAIQQLMEDYSIEYADFYCAGIPESCLQQAGFCLRDEQDSNILPNYLEPPLIENTDYYYFTSNPDHFVICKADGDQDRPNLP